MDAAGSYTSVSSLATRGVALQLVAFDADGDGIDEAAARLDNEIVSVTIEAQTLAAGATLLGGGANHMTVLRTEGNDKLVVARDGGRSSVVELDDAGEVVVDDAGLFNPWGADLVVGLGSKYGVIGNDHGSGGALAVPGTDPLATLAVPAGASSVASLGDDASIAAVGGSEALQVVVFDDADEACTLSVPIGPVDGVALADLGEGVLGVADDRRRRNAAVHPRRSARPALSRPSWRD